MTLRYSTAVRNAKLDAVEAAIGAGAILKIRSGAQPGGLGLADAGVVLASLALPADWMAAAANGSKAKLGTWSDAAADAAGTAGHFRIYAADGITAHVEGSITATGGGGDMTVDNTVLAAGQEFTVTGFQINDNNA